MELVKIEKAETKVYLELTETEFNTILYYYGIAPISDAEKMAKNDNVKILNSADGNVLYDFLHDVRKELNK
jgi:hypothetical protein